MTTLPTIEGKSLTKPTNWSKDVENAYRFQLAGYRDESEYKIVRQVDQVSEMNRRINEHFFFSCSDRFLA